MMVFLNFVYKVKISKFAKMVREKWTQQKRSQCLKFGYCGGARKFEKVTNGNPRNENKIISIKKEIRGMIE